jgi:phosphoglucosamine mutase
MSDFATTGDGLVAALQVLGAVVQSGRPASAVCRRFEKLPQVLVNVRYQGASPLDKLEVRQAIAAAEASLSATGRLLIRPSGTEPVIRVMAEGEDESLVDSVANELAELIAQHCQAQVEAE